MASNQDKVDLTETFSALGMPSESDSKVVAPTPASKKQSGKPPAEPKVEREWTAELQSDYERIMSIGEECISEGDLKKLLTNKGRGSGHAGFNLYDGFEPSGRMHIAQGVFKAMNVNKCTAEGTNSTFVFWVADWFALMNDKMGGDLEKIKTVGKYLIEVWKAAGMELSHVVFKWASEEITNNADKYWPTMLDVARRFNITRIKKCCQIMGRMEGSLTAAQMLYPLMQCTDVFFLKADICQLGVDQRKVNMLAREYCEAAKIKNKPVILSHHMLYGLKAGQAKMSKSDPDSAVFMEDSAEDVERKIMNAYCPTTKEVTATSIVVGEDEDAGKESMSLVVDEIKNPCLDYIENIIFSPPGATFTAGSTIYSDFATVRSKFLSGDISEEELKRGLIASLNSLLEPVRSHFTNDETARNLLALVQGYKKEELPKDKAVRRLNLVELGKAPANSHVVFAPLPNANPTLQEAVDILALLRQSNGRPTVLFLSDWSARVCNACDADIKGIAAYYTILTAALKALDPETMENTKVIVQSEAILADPSNYWISVINVGRHFMLNDVMGPAMKDADGAGFVIARLMRVADVAGLEPASLQLSEGPEADVISALVTRFFEEQLPALSKPQVSISNGPLLSLQQRESDAHKTENDEFFLLDDPKVCTAWEAYKKHICRL
jgi:tyrosyl-tRNA synthetase